MSGVFTIAPISIRLPVEFFPFGSKIATGKTLNSSGEIVHAELVRAGIFNILYRRVIYLAHVGGEIN